MVMIAAAAALGYAMLRSSNASAAKVDASPGSSAFDGSAQGGSSGLGSSLSKAVSSALDSVYDAVVSSPGVASPGSSGTSSQPASTPLPVSGVTAVEDPARVASLTDADAVDAANRRREYRLENSGD